MNKIILAILSLASILEISLGENRKANIAIIGSGINGALCAYYLRKTIGSENINIDIYDNHTYKQPRIPLHVHDNHRHIHEIIQNTNREIRLENIYGNAKPIIYDGFDNYSYALDIDWFKKRTPKPFEKISDFLKKSYHDFRRIYELQNQGNSYQTVRGLLNAINPELINYMEKNIGKFLQDTLNINSNEVANKNLIVFLRAILAREYMQNLGTHALSGISTFWFSEIIGGTVKKIVTPYEHVIRTLSAGSNFKGGKVLNIQRKENSNYLSWKNNGDSVLDINYDFIVIADNQVTNLKDFPFLQFKSQIRFFEYDEVYQTLFKGDLEKTASCTQRNVYTKIPAVLNIKDMQVYRKSSKNYWSVLSYKYPTEQEIGKFFNVSLLKVSKHMEKILYPKYSVIQNAEKARFDLGENIYNVNAIEWVNVSLEMLAIGARNVALLILKKLPHHNDYWSHSGSHVGSESHYKSGSQVGSGSHVGLDHRSIQHEHETYEISQQDKVGNSATHYNQQGIYHDQSYNKDGYKKSYESYHNKNDGNSSTYHTKKGTDITGSHLALEPHDLQHGTYDHSSKQFKPDHNKDGSDVARHN